MLIEVSQDLGIMRRMEIVSRLALDDRAGVMGRLKQDFDVNNDNNDIKVRRKITVQRDKCVLTEVGYKEKSTDYVNSNRGEENKNATLNYFKIRAKQIFSHVGQIKDTSKMVMFIVAIYYKCHTE